MLQPGREYSPSTSSGLYRYGFNGKENDNEVKGEGNQQDYGMRIYDPRLGRFLSVDPFSKDYPELTSYQFASNNPVFAIDIDGMEADKILNMARSLLYTPYEYGGKSPAPELIGSIKPGTEGREYWETKLRPKLQVISDYYPDHYRKGKGEICSPRDLDEQSKAVKKGIYEEFSRYSKNGNLGMDCSAFVWKSYSEDKELLFDPQKVLETGSQGQLNAFEKLAKEGKAYVHQDFNLISAGDFVKLTTKKDSHVMIATGNVRTVNGKVTEFETYEANSTQEGSITKWRPVSKIYTIGHPFRTSDTGRTLVIPVGWGLHVFKLPLPSSNPETRTRENLQQKVENNKNNP